MLDENALLQCPSLVEQHVKRDLAGLADRKMAGLAKFLVVRHCGDGPFLRFEDVNLNSGVVRQQGAAPAARAE